MKKLLALAILLTSTFALADMTVVGSGSRYKSFFWIPVHVYDAKLSVSDPAAFVRDMADTKALDSLASMKQKSLELTFARYVEAEKVVSGFAEALTANNIADSDNMKALKKAVLDLGAINTDDVMTFKADLDTGVLTVSKGSESTELKGDSAFFQNVFAMWLGVTADDGLADLKKQLIGG